MFLQQHRIESNRIYRPIARGLLITVMIFWGVYQ